MREKPKKLISENDARLILMLLVFVSGALLGAIFSDGYGNSVVMFRKNAGFEEIFFHEMKGSVLLYLIFFLLGFSSVSLPAEIFLAMFAGQGMGALLNSAFSECGLFFMLTMLPSAAVFAAAAALGARESARMSAAVFRRTFLPDEYTPADIKLYILKFAAISAIGAAGAFIGAFTALLFR